MASGRISIAVGLETSEVRKGAKDAEKALENLEDAVGDTSKGGAKDLDKLEDELKDVQRQSKKTGDSVGRDLDDGFDKASKGADEFKSEADGTAREVAASFDGSAESIAGGFQELAANAFAGFGPLGAVAGLAAAAGIGVAFQAINADAEAAEQRISDMYDDMLESGNRYLSDSFVQKGIGEIAGDQGKYNDALKLSKQLGVDVNDVVRAMAGDTEKGNQLLDDANRKRQEELDSVDDMNLGINDQLGMINAINGKYDAMTGAINGVVTAEDSAASRVKSAQSAMSDYLLDVVKNSKDATREVTEFGDTIVTLPDGKQVIIDAETGQATDDMDAIEQRDFTPKTAVVRVEVDDTRWKQWNPVVKNGRVEAYVMGTGRQVM